MTTQIDDLFKRVDVIPRLDRGIQADSLSVQFAKKKRESTNHLDPPVKPQDDGITENNLC